MDLFWKSTVTRCPMNHHFDYDVFLSYAAKDGDSAENLAQQLKAEGLRIWFDRWNLSPDVESLDTEVTRGLKSSRALVLLWSEHANGRAWPMLDRQVVLFRDPAHDERRFIPVQLDDTPKPATLSALEFYDLRKDGLAKLKMLCSPQSIQQGKEERHSLPILANVSNFGKCLALTPDGRRALASTDKSIRVWDIEKRTCIASLQGDFVSASCAAVTPDGRRAIASGYMTSIHIWDLETFNLLVKLEGHSGGVHGLVVTPDGRRAISGGGTKDPSLRVWELEKYSSLVSLHGHTAAVWGVAVTPDGRRAVSVSNDKTVRVWDLEKYTALAILKGHSDSVWGVAVTPDGRRAVSVSDDRTVRVWDLEKYTALAILEGHTARVRRVAVTPNGRRAISGSSDETVRIWDLEKYAPLAAVGIQEDQVDSLFLSPNGRRAYSTSVWDKTLRVWDLELTNAALHETAIIRRYVNAKVLLVGDSGVGKSGLAIRLTRDCFQPTSSTDGVWTAQMPLLRIGEIGGVEREVWLWDFAGQSDYRLIHQLFMDETALAILVFNPQSNNPFEGLNEWNRAIDRATRQRLQKLLVAARCDRGGLMVSAELVDQFLKENGFVRYIPTSALTGEGCMALRRAIIENIDWSRIPHTVSPITFHHLKEAIIRLRNEGIVLLRLSDLQQRVMFELMEDGFSMDQLRAAVGLLAGPGLVWQLGFGDIVLLRPELINAYAAAVVRTVRQHAEEIGVIAEQDVLEGRLQFTDLKRLPVSEESIVLRAMHQTFIEYGICVREHAERGALLVFPSYFRRERPELGEHPTILVTYQFHGALDEIYATLVVRLLHTQSFSKDQLWRDAADFKTVSGKRLGLKMTRRANGQAEMAIYSEHDVPDETKVLFIRYVHDHLKRNDSEMTRLRHYTCPHCHIAVPNLDIVRRRLERGLTDIVCQNCEVRVPLIDLIEEQFPTEEVTRKVRELEIQAKTGIDNESRELMLIGHAYTITAEAGQIYRGYTNSDHGIDGEIEFKGDDGTARYLPPKAEIMSFIMASCYIPQT
jgi:small GTP-binding protein